MTEDGSKDGCELGVTSGRVVRLSGDIVLLICWIVMFWMAVLVGTVAGWASKPALCGYALALLIFAWWAMMPSWRVIYAP